jgi:hypothetical protein
MVSEKCIDVVLETEQMGLLVAKQVVVGPCHHDMARPQVVDGGTTSYTESSCEYI